MKIDLEATAGKWLVQGEVEVDGRRFWYRCRSGLQSLIELDEDFIWERETCLCEALGHKHLSWEPEHSNPCEHVWSDDLAEHSFYAGLCVPVLMKLPPLEKTQ
jgi:hypothetical protein